jgi:hypothetical protein
MMPWLVYLIVIVVVMEIGICWIYNYLRKKQPEYTIWVVLSSMAVKVVIAAIMMLTVHFLTEVPLTEFSMWMLGCMFVGLVAETIYFLKKK